MNNSRANYFKVLISPYIKGKLTELESAYGKDSWEYNSIAKQYEYSENEESIQDTDTNKHYEANAGLTNVERLYRHHCCVELNFSCAAHCRYCLRSNYDGFVINDKEIEDAVNFMKENKLDEVLITGGDPFLSPKKLSKFIYRILDEVPTMKVIRIATRTFTQNPTLVNDEVLRILSTAKKRCRVEVATQIGSPIELTWDETIAAFKRVLDLDIPVYSQNVFMKDVNDTPEHLIDLYERMRSIGIQPHYLFDCISIKGVDHFKSSFENIVYCYEQLVNSGNVTGRSKPLLAFMTQIGKIVLTPFNLIKVGDGFIALRSRYKYLDRLAWNPEFKIPKGAWVDHAGYLCINYPIATNVSGDPVHGLSY